MKKESEGLSAEDLALIAAVLLVITDAIGLLSLIKAKQEKK